ncbi:YdcF family protein [Kitasatospora sp. NBC_00374]|uniref:YdcF family protein n=1 Tax=Kitasatospora sp. NBC_00374 TaxID=2975964 RepID=UPI0030E49971
MPAYALAVAFLVAFAVGVRRDRRRFGNAVLLGLAVLCLALGLLGELAGLPAVVTDGAAAAIPPAAALGLLAVAVYLVANGVTMVRQEGGGTANLFSLALGLAILGLIALLLAAEHLDSRALRAAAGGALLIAGYLAFLFLCFLGYAALYVSLTVRRDVDFVLVLGAGLLDGDQVPPLLASRLDRAWGLYQVQAARGRPPTVIVSGGKGTDERVPESQAMADHLVARGCPPGRIEQENRSRTTEENLTFSRVLMERRKPGYRCAVVTSTFHVFRSAVIARRAGVPGQVLGAHTASYYWPSAVIREFVAVLALYGPLNAGVVALLGILGAVAGWSAVNP